MTAGTTRPSARDTARAARWSATAVAGRQAAQLAFALVLAKLLGPHTFGIVSAATIYVTLSMLLLDQGLSAGLIQRPRLAATAPGAVASANLATSAALAALTWVLAPAIAGFFGSSELSGLLRVLGVGLLLKAAAITPRAMLSRELRLKEVAVADLAGAATGSLAGLAAALAGASYWSLAVQTLVTDAVVAAVLLKATPGILPNRDGSQIRLLLPFSGRVFATNGVAYASRNVDNIAVGHVLGPSALSEYAMAYRVLVIPVQLVGQTVNRVLFPTLSRSAGDRARVGAVVVGATEVLALVTVPPMALLACAAPQLVHVVLGPPWAATAPIMSVLAVAGARETIYYLTPTLMRATGHAALGLRFEIFSTAVQTLGILLGLRFGALGVACGYAIAGVVVTPVLMHLQRRLSGVDLRRQLSALAPAVHASAWASAAYLLVARGVDSPVAVLLVGGVAFVAVASSVLTVAHRRAASRVLRRVGSVRSGAGAARGAGAA